MENKLKIIAGVVGVFFVVLLSCAYTIDERDTAIKFRFREIVDDNLQPGLHFRMPLIETVNKYPRRILTLDASSERFLTGEKKYVLVDFFVKWRIDDVATFYRATGGQVINAERRLEDIMKDGLRNEFSRRTIEEALSEQRDDIMQGLEQKSNEIASTLGAEVVDVRVSKIDFPEQVSESVFNRMRSERNRVAQDFRSRGQEEAEKIRATADRQATVLMAEAYRESETMRGEGDAQAAETYARAYQEDAEFYSFYRSLTAYRNALGREGDMLVLDPDSDFFRHFKERAPTSFQGESSANNLQNNAPARIPAEPSLSQKPAVSPENNSAALQ